MDTIKYILHRISRRNFFKAAGAMLAATALTGSAPASAEARTPNVVDEQDDEIFLHAPGIHIPR